MRTPQRTEPLLKSIPVMLFCCAFITGCGSDDQNAGDQSDWDNGASLIGAWKLDSQMWGDGENHQWHLDLRADRTYSSERDYYPTQTGSWWVVDIADTPLGDQLWMDYNYGHLELKHVYLYRFEGARLVLDQGGNIYYFLREQSVQN